MSDGAGAELLQVLIPYFASLIGYDEYLTFQIKEAEIPVNVNVHEPSVRGVDTTSDGRISHNGCTVGIIEVQSRRASGSTQKQLLVGCLGHIAKPENVMLLGFALYKHYSAIIMGLRTEESYDGRKKVQILGATDSLSLLKVDDFHGLIYYFCEALKKSILIQQIHKVFS